MLELRRLRYLIVLAKRLSFSRASEDLGLTQSALSRAIQSLERDLNVQLFDRDTSGVSLTEHGRWIVEKAEALLISANEFELQVQSLAKGLEGRVRFGITPTPAAALLPALSSRLRSMPDFVHQVVVEKAETLWLKLAQGDIEFMVCSDWSSIWPVPDSMPLRVESLGHLPINLIVRAGHPLLMDSSHVRSFPLLVSDKIALSNEASIALREKLASSVQTFSDVSTLRSLVSQTDAIWLTSAYVAIDDLVQGHFVQLRMPVELKASPIEVFMYSLDRRSKSATVLEIERAFRSRLTALGKQIPPQPDIKSYQP